MASTSSIEATSSGSAATSRWMARSKMLVADGAAGGLEDQVDEDVAVPRLQEPALRWALGPHADVDKRLQGALRVRLAEEEVHVVVGRRATVGPRGEAAAEQERDLGVAQGRGALLHRVDELREALARRVGHERVYPGRR